MFIHTTPEDEATGEVGQMYADIRASMGHVPNFVKAFSHRPEVLAAWEGALTAIRDNMDFRRYEIATVGAARGITSSYCMLAHGSALMREEMTVDELEALARDGGGVSDEERAIFFFAGKVSRNATSVTQDDIDELKSFGLSDTEIFDISAAAAIRCFISKMADAMGAQPDSHYLGLPDALRDVLVVGRPIEDAPA